MTPKEACKILGLPQDAGLQEIKKKYRLLMMQVHPDANVSSKEKYTYNAQEINLAYSVLKREPSPGRKETPVKEKGHAVWNAPVNVNAYTEREILHYAETHDGAVLGSFCIARGKYLWTVEEDFPLFLLSIYQCGKQLLDGIDASLGRNNIPAIRQGIQTELTYLLAQQFIAGASLLKEFAKEEKSHQDGHRVFYIPSMLEASNRTVSPKAGEALYPSKFRSHKLYLKNRDGQELGYLSFTDDRLYYIVIPLFEQKRVQVKIQVAKKQPEKMKKTAVKYQNLHLWIKLHDRNTTQMPENLNLQIEQLLLQYKQ